MQTRWSRTPVEPRAFDAPGDATVLRLHYLELGGCSDPDVELIETPTEVLVGLYHAASSGKLTFSECCVELTLERPLGNRCVRDWLAGRAIPHVKDLEIVLGNEPQNLRAREQVRQRLLEASNARRVTPKRLPEVNAWQDPHPLVRGFPAAVREDARAVADILPEPQHPMSDRKEEVWVRQERLQIPYRIYNHVLPAAVAENLSESQRLIAGCVYTRHHDGLVRETACATIVAQEEPWVVPYIVQLLGEYVVEIQTLILERLTKQASFHSPSYQDFARENDAFIGLTEQRAISYWSRYHRADFSRDEYPALVALDRLRRPSLH